MIGPLPQAARFGYLYEQPQIHKIEVIQILSPVTQVYIRDQKVQDTA